MMNPLLTGVRKAVYRHGDSGPNAPGADPDKTMPLFDHGRRDRCIPSGRTSGCGVRSSRSSRASPTRSDPAMQPDRMRGELSTSSPTQTSAPPPGSTSTFTAVSTWTPSITGTWTPTPTEPPGSTAAFTRTQTWTPSLTETCSPTPVVPPGSTATAHPCRRTFPRGPFSVLASESQGAVRDGRDHDRGGDRAGAERGDGVLERVSEPLRAGIAEHEHGGTG